MRFDFIMVYFIYGLAFFSMGLAMMMEARRSPVLAEAHALKPLAFFGFVHGFHEWLEIVLEVRQWFGFLDLAIAPYLRLILLVVSFCSLVLYSLQVLRPSRSMIAPSNGFIVTGWMIFYGILVWSTSLMQADHSQHWWRHADALARYTLAVPGASMAALALLRQAQLARQTRQDNPLRGMLSLFLRVAGFGFAIYSLTQFLAPPVDIFPANVFNTSTFMVWAGFPIQAVRAAMAVLITYGLIRATQVTEDERSQQLATAQEARLQALEQVQRDLVERETMRRELLRHTVVAQEDERARIARELHDETAQYLTALSLDLATLRNMLRRNPRADAILQRLQALSRQVSQGIYRMVRDLRPAQLDDLGLAPALTYLADEARSNGLEVTLTVLGERQRLEPLVETVLFRIAQEAITNVARHAGSGEATVILDYGEEQVSLTVRDRGVGFNPEAILQPPHGWGLVGMRERAESAGASFKIESASGRGTSVGVVVPLPVMERQMREEGVDEYDPVDVGR